MTPKKALFTLFFTLFLLPLILFAKPPELTSKEVKTTMDQILKSHVSYKELSPELIVRIFNNFINEFDPMKTYLIENEIDAWLTPSEALCKKTLKEIQASNFQEFEKIHAAILPAIQRRNTFEKKLASLPIPSSTTATITTTPSNVSSNVSSAKTTTTATTASTDSSSIDSLSLNASTKKLSSSKETPNSQESQNPQSSKIVSIENPDNQDDDLLTKQDFSKLPWTKNEDELFSRLVKIKTLQSQAAKKFTEEKNSLFFQLLNKRRLNKEQEILSTDKERKFFTYTCLLKAFATALDAHTDYFTPAEANQFIIQVQQRLFGIGIQLRDNLNGFSILRILEGGPAAKSSKIKINDIIIAVNHEPVAGMDITDAVELIRGEKDTKVLLTLLREEIDSETSQAKTQTFDIELTRGEVVLEEGRLETSFEPYGDGIIAYIRLFSFYQDPMASSTQDVKKALEKFKAEYNLKGVVLDLRNNSGGLLPQAVGVAGLFINKGIVVSVKDNAQNIQHLRNMDGFATWEGPLVVLVNRASASAAEIVAQSLQDYGRAILVGDDHTFGKGTFQTFTLDASHNAKINPQGEYKVTRGMYYTVSGKSPQLVGVKSDIVVPGILSEIDIGETFSKYPLQNGSIAAHFDDDLSDIPLSHRKKLSLLYKHNLQQKISSYTQYLEPLIANSQKRLKANKNYQNFLQEIAKKRFETESVELFGQSDLQLTETYNIMKDLIFFLEINYKYAVND